MSYDIDEIYECANCGRKAEWIDLPDARDLWSRLLPGDIYTDKECADLECGALCFPVKGDQP